MSALRKVGEWEVLGRIGTGSFSIVWQGRHRRTKQLSAIKEITTAKLSPECFKCLDAELAAMREVHHPNIVSFYELIKEPQRMFIVMEFCKDGELQKVISQGRATEEFTKSMMSQLAAGLRALRAAKIIHRDLKPANLLLSDGVLKIADFGFARNLPSQNLADTLCGTPLYMAPEVLQRKKYDARADLWSVGVILYEMLVGTPPFAGQNYIHLMHNIETKPLRIPKSVMKKVSEECIDLLVRLLQRDPHKRIDFDDFFRHPFFDELIGYPPVATPTSPALPVLDEGRAFEDSIYPEEDEFSYSIDDDFVVVSKVRAEDQIPDDIQDAHLFRIAEWTMSYAEDCKSKPVGFLTALLSVQILRHLDSTSPHNYTKRRLGDALKKAEDFSKEVDEEQINKECNSMEIYGLLFKDAIVCAQTAAADELCGQYYASCEAYSRSIDLMEFLIHDGYDVPLEPVLEFPEDQKEQLRLLVSTMKQRMEKCTPSL